MGVDEELQLRQDRERQRAIAKLLNDPTATRVEVDALLRLLARCDGGTGGGAAGACLRIAPGIAMWRTHDDRHYCDDHHALGYPGVELPYARDLRALLGRFRA